MTPAPLTKPRPSSPTGVVALGPDQWQLARGPNAPLLILGLTAALAGALMVALGIADPGSPEETSILLAVALPTLFVGLVPCFARERVLLDRAAGSLLLTWGTDVTLWRRRRSLSPFSAVRVRFVAGSADAGDRFEVELVGANTAAVRLASFGKEAGARSLAEPIGEFLALPVAETAATVRRRQGS